MCAYRSKHAMEVFGLIGLFFVSWKHIGERAATHTHTHTERETITHHCSVVWEKKGSYTNTKDEKIQQFVFLHILPRHKRNLV